MNNFINGILVTLFLVSAVALAEEYCYDPYGSAVIPEWKANQTTILVTWTDAPRGGGANSEWMYDEVEKISICRIWVRMPEQILSDPDMDSLGHEVLHCLTGDFHPED